jgi:hypothetical protein
MIVTLKLEAIGDDSASALGRFARMERELGIGDGRSGARRPWVAEIAEWRGGRWYERTFLKGQKDYSEANSAGSRGVYLYYHLREGSVYEVHELLTWRSERRYFCTVSGGRLVEMSADEVQSAMSERAEARRV